MGTGTGTTTFRPSPSPSGVSFSSAGSSGVEITLEDILARLLTDHSASHAACAAENSFAQSVVCVLVVGLDREGEHRTHRSDHHATVLELSTILVFLSSHMSSQPCTLEPSKCTLQDKPKRREGAQSAIDERLRFGVVTADSAGRFIKRVVSLLPPCFWEG